MQREGRRGEHSRNEVYSEFLGVTWKGIYIT